MHHIRITRGKYKNFQIKINKKLAENEEFKPSSSTAVSILMNVLTHNDFIELENSDAIDIFCCTGRVGIEMLSCGAKSCTFLDYNRKLLDNIEFFFKDNKINEKFNTHNIDIEKKDKKSIKDIIENKDIIFIDPPYDKISKVINIIEFVKNDAIVIIEFRNNTYNDIKNAISYLKFEIIKEKKIDKDKSFIFLKKSN